MCQALGVARSGYYAWETRPVSEQERKNRVLAFHIRAIHRDTDGTYGAPRITEELKASGMVCSENRVARIKQKMGLRAIASPRKFRCTTQAVSDAFVAPDLIERNFAAERPNQKWVSDITYIPVRKSQVYLCIVMDLFSRKIVGWSLRTSLLANLAIESLKKACQDRKPMDALILHTDRGCQYTCRPFQSVLAEYGIKSSMGRKGDCYDNAVAESFFSTLKTERVKRESYATIHQARHRIADYIRFYNKQRRHSTLGHKSPDTYERLRAA
jgi:transposase InsO family protein